MHPTRQAIVRALKSFRQATVKDLADTVGVKAITVRHHLNGLQAEGLVDVREQRQSIGRPLHYYSLACPYVLWEKRQPEVCQIDEILISALLDADGAKGSCLLAGDLSCAYGLQKA